MKIRINNIECISTSTVGTYQILKYYPNDYFGMKENYMDQGWYVDGDFLRSPGPFKTSIQLSIFDRSESCCVIADLIYNSKEPDVDLQSVGSRILELAQEDRNDFFQVYEIANNKILNKL